MIGIKLSPVLSEIETTLLEFNVFDGNKPEYTMEGFRAGVYIFMSVLMDKAFELQENENIDMEDRIKMAKKIGEDIRNLIKIYTDIDTYDFYK